MEKHLGATRSTDRYSQVLGDLSYKAMAGHPTRQGSAITASKALLASERL
jgi:hypothetical protein